MIRQNHDTAPVVNALIEITASSRYTHFPRPGWGRSRLWAGVWLLVAALISVLARPAICQEIPPEEIYRKAKPATVLVQTSFKLEFSVPAVVNLDAKTLSGKVAALVKKNGGTHTPQLIAQALTTELVEHPVQYLEIGPKLKTIEMKGGGHGSGFLVTPEGHVVTNAHVVTVDHRKQEELLASKVPKAEVQSTLKRLEREIPEVRSLGENQKIHLEKLVTKAYAKAYRRFGRFEGKRDLKVVKWADGNVSDKTVKVFPASLVGSGKPVPGKDVAILKIEGGPFPTVSLGDDSKMEVGSQIFVVGFPGAAYMPGLLSEASKWECTMTSGIVSARKTTPAGWTVLQTDVAISPGNSGGPAFDRTGKVIGIATFSAVDVKTSRRVEGIHYLMPATIIRECLERFGVRLDASP